MRQRMFAQGSRGSIRWQSLSYALLLKMNRTITITPNEQSRLQRILSVSDLESQRRVAYWFWAMAAVLFVAGLVGFLWHTMIFATLVPTSFVALMIGCTRHGYYKLFRLIQYQHFIHADSREFGA